jgi:hypothetical protein
VEAAARILCFAAGLYGVGATLKESSKVLRGIGLFFALLAPGYPGTW